MPVCVYVYKSHIDTHSVSPCLYVFVHNFEYVCMHAHNHSDCVTFMCMCVCLCVHTHYHLDYLTHISTNHTSTRSPSLYVRVCLFICACVYAHVRVCTRVIYYITGHIRLQMCAHTHVLLIHKWVN